MSVASSAFEYLWIESVPLCKEITAEIGNADENEVMYRMEKHGFNVGRGLAYVYMKDETQKLDEISEIIKFLCREFWVKMFKKQVDNLKTNHMDAYILIDNTFPMCMRMSTNLNSKDAIQAAKPYMWFPCGLIRGFLDALSIKSTVSFEIVELPRVDFTIQIDQ